MYNSVMEEEERNMVLVVQSLPQLGTCVHYGAEQDILDMLTLLY